MSTPNNGEHTTMDIFTTNRLRMERLDEAHLPGYHNIWSNPLAAKWSLHGVCKTLEDSRQFMSGVLQKNNPRGENFAVHLLSSSSSSSCSSSPTTMLASSGSLKPPTDIVSPSALVTDEISNTARLAAVITATTTDDQLCEPSNDNANAGENQSTESPTMAMIGVMGTYRTDPVAELGYIFHPSSWGKGYATEAVSAFVDRFWSEQPTVNEIEAQVDPANFASVKVLGKCGFALVAEADEDGEKVFIFRIFRPGLYE